MNVMTKSLKRIDRVIIDSRDPITGLKTGNMRGAPHRDTRYDESLTKIINDPDPQSSLSIDFLPLTILFSLLSSV